MSKQRTNCILTISKQFEWVVENNILSITTIQKRKSQNKVEIEHCE
jgi:hypothetical protein